MHDPIQPRDEHQRKQKWRPLRRWAKIRRAVIQTMFSPKYAAPVVASAVKQAGYNVENAFLQPCGVSGSSLFPPLFRTVQSGTLPDIKESIDYQMLLGWNMTFYRITQNLTTHVGRKISARSRAYLAFELLPANAVWGGVIPTNEFCGSSYERG